MVVLPLALAMSLPLCLLASLIFDIQTSSLLQLEVEWPARHHHNRDLCNVPL